MLVAAKIKLIGPRCRRHVPLQLLLLAPRQGNRQRLHDPLGEVVLQFEQIA